MGEINYEQLNEILKSSTENFANYEQIYDQYLEQEKKVLDLMIESCANRGIQLPQGITREITIEEFNQLPFANNTDESIEENNYFLAFYLAINWVIERDTSNDFSTENTAEAVASLIYLQVPQTELQKWLLVLHDLTQDENLITWSKLETDLAAVEDIEHALKDIEIKQTNYHIRTIVQTELIESLRYLFGEHDNLNDLANSIILHCTNDILDMKIGPKTPKKSYFEQNILRKCDGYIDRSSISIIIDQVVNALKDKGYSRSDS